MKHMPAAKSLDVPKVIDSILCDVFASHIGVFSTLNQKHLRRKMKKRLASEGIGFLTRTLPAIGKDLDQVLAGSKTFNCADHDLKPIVAGSKLPKLFGELFERVLHSDGTLRKKPCINSVRTLRQICYLFYKYELPYTYEQRNTVVQAFKQAEDDLTESDLRIAQCVTWITEASAQKRQTPPMAVILRAARHYLHRLFEHFDPKGIVPRHGPGAVAQREQFSGKYRWSTIPDRLTDEYPIDAYFYASLGHVCDEYDQLSRISGSEPGARVVLVPKDSRGPRLISCEPVALQWIQQGLREGIYRCVEENELSKFNIFFTNQRPNQLGALLGSERAATGARDGYATLDLKEASDRISVALVSALYPEPLKSALLAARSQFTVLPSPDGREDSQNGERVVMKKYAPMGSALCFPIMACTIFAILRATMWWFWDTVTRDRAATLLASVNEATKDGLSVRKLHLLNSVTEKARQETIKEKAELGVSRILVYGDDIVVPQYFARPAISALELFGLKANLHKCCSKGLFRESCGVDALSGVNVTPVKLKTVWDTSSSAEVIESWVEYTNSLLARGFRQTAQYLADELERRFGPIPSDYCIQNLESVIHFKDPHGILTQSYWASRFRFKTRFNSDLQKLERRYLLTRPKKVVSKTSGWNYLLRWFTERSRGQLQAEMPNADRRILGPLKGLSGDILSDCQVVGILSGDALSVYTAPRTSVLVRGWR